MAILADLMSAGVAPELVERVALAIAEARAEGARSGGPQRTTRQERNARYYEARRDRLKASETVLKAPYPVLIKTFKTVSDVPPAEPRVRAFSMVDSSSKIPPSETTSPLSPTPKSEKTRGNRLPVGWEPPEELFAFGLKLGFSRRTVSGVLAEFRDYWCSVPGAKGLKLDWEATFRNRLREKVERRSMSQQPRAPPPRRQTSRNMFLHELMPGIFDDPPADNRPFEPEFSGPIIEAGK